MHRITIRDIDAGRAIDYKNQLLSDGLSLVQDFTWEYCPSVHEAFDMKAVRHANYDFLNKSMATFYQLKWM